MQDTDGNNIKNVKYAKTFLANASTYNFTNNSNASIILRNDGQIFVATTDDYQPLKYENGTSVKNVDAVKPGFYNILMTFLDEDPIPTHTHTITPTITKTKSPSFTNTPTKTPSITETPTITPSPSVTDEPVEVGIMHTIFGKQNGERFGLHNDVNREGENRIVASAHGANNNKGLFRVYNFNGTEWIQQGSDILVKHPMKVLVQV